MHKEVEEKYSFWYFACSSNADEFAQPGAAKSKKRFGFFSPTNQQRLLKFFI